MCTRGSLLNAPGIRPNGGRWWLRILFLAWVVVCHWELRSAVALECVSAGDAFTAPKEDLVDVNLGPVRVLAAQLPDGSPALLSVRDCDEDGAMDVWVPWSEGSANPPAVIVMSPNLCEGNAPQKVEVILRHYNFCKLQAYDDAANLVATAEAAPASTLQSLVLQSPMGIRRIVIVGSEICIVRICWECDVDVPPDEQFRRGDTNSDGSTDISDAIGILGYLFLGSEAPSCEKAADMDDNGSLEISDAIYGLNFLFLGGPELPAPFRVCGVDPTPDPLRCLDYRTELCP